MSKRQKKQRMLCILSKRCYPIWTCADNTAQYGDYAEQIGPHVLTTARPAFKKKRGARGGRERERELSLIHISAVSYTHLTLPTKLIV